MGPLVTRFKCTLEYDGTPYAGWQWQEGQPSAQGALERAIRDFCQEDLRVQCAGRTDAGVHAIGQVVHFDLTKDRTAYQVMEGVNFHLLERNESVRVLSCEAVDDEFHARFHATSRRYLYHIINRRAPLALQANRAWQIGHALDLAAMRKGAALLIGHHDFSSFRAAECQAESPVKTLDKLQIEQDGQDIRIHLQARSFLHNQVRIMVGSLVKVGSGKWQLMTFSACCKPKTAPRQAQPPRLTGCIWQRSIMRNNFV